MRISLGRRQPYDGSVADGVRADPRTRRIVGHDWSLRAERLETVEGFDHHWSALVGVRRGLNLLVTCIDQDLRAEAWAGEPEKSDGVAVIDIGEGDIRLDRMPLCSCGDRGCGNAGVQLYTWLDGAELPALVELLRDLPWTHTIPGRDNVLRGSGLGALRA
jgi:hypothetical protein